MKLEMKLGQQLESAGENEDKLGRGEARQLFPCSGEGCVLGETSSLASAAKSASSEATNMTRDLTSKGHSEDAPGPTSRVEKLR